MSTMMRAAQFQPGGPELLTIGEAPIPALRDSEVLIKVHATAINRADTVQRMGKYPPPAGESLILGLEAAGVVDKVKEGVSRWKVGDRVMALVPGGGNAEYVTVNEGHIMPVHKEMTFHQAAAIPEVWLTSFQLLHFVGQLQAGETVLVHAGGSGVGTAAVQLIQLAGATAIVTAGSQEKIDTAVSLGAKAGLNYKEGRWADKVLELTQGKGVDLILDCVGGPYWEQNTAAIAIDGRLVLYGLLGGTKADGDVLAKIIWKRITVVGSTLRPRSTQYKADLVKSFTEKALPHFTTGTLKTIIHTVLPLDQLSEAHQQLEDNKNTGKIVIEVQPGSGKHEEL